jgi:hypothetical protein
MAKKMRTRKRNSFKRKNTSRTRRKVSRKSYRKQRRRKRTNRRRLNMRGGADVTSSVEPRRDTFGAQMTPEQEKEAAEIEKGEETARQLDTSRPGRRPAGNPIPTDKPWSNQFATEMRRKMKIFKEQRPDVFGPYMAGGPHNTHSIWEDRFSELTEDQRQNAKSCRNWADVENATKPLATLITNYYKAHPMK